MTEPEPGPIPLSSALAEANSMSLNLLFSMDVESPTFRAGLPRLVKALREQAERFKASEAEGKRPAKAKKGEGVKDASEGKASDLGF